MGKIETFRYKTNIDCISCIEKIRNILDVQENLQYWYVNPLGEDHVLTLMGENLPVESIIRKVKEAGFEMTRI